MFSGSITPQLRSARRIWGLVKVDVVQRDMLLLIGLFLVDQMLHDAALEQVLGNDFVHIIGT